MPAISVIVPYYNDDIQCFQTCIGSILNQTFSDFEILVIDDGSQEKNRKHLHEIELIDKRISVYRQENKGVSAARNYGVSLAEGEYIVFVDADDILLPPL